MGMKSSKRFWTWPALTRRPGRKSETQRGLQRRTSAKNRPKSLQKKSGQNRAGGGGGPGHKGVSHHVKPDRTILYTAEICDECGRTDLELLPPINKLSVNFGKIDWAEEENKEPKKEDRKDAYTARAIFGWCDPCRRLIDPAPHLTWGTWLRGMALAATIQFKSNPLGRATIIDNLGTMHKFWIAAGATSNAITACANSLEGRTLPPSVIAWVKAKMEAKTDSVDKCDTPPVQEATVPEGPEDNPPDDTTTPEATAPSPAHHTIPPKTTRRMTKKERKAEENRVPHGQTPQGITDAFLTHNTTSYPGSHALSFLERCREWLTMAPHMGVDETKTVVAGKWCHTIVARSPNVVMMAVRPRKNTKTINWMFGGMLHVCVVHDRIVIYNGFTGMHQECWAHLIRRFRRLAMKRGVGSPEYDRYVVIKALYKRAKNLTERVAAHVGVPSNAAEAAACPHMLDGIWHLFEPEYASIMDGLLGLVKYLDGREPGKYLEKMLRRSLTFVKRPGTPGTNNDAEGSIRWDVIRPRHVFGALPNWRAARNFGVIQTFAATCRKNGVSPYHAVLARGVTVSLFEAVWPRGTHAETTHGLYGFAEPPRPDSWLCQLNKILPSAQTRSIWLIINQDVQVPPTRQWWDKHTDGGSLERNLSA